MIRGLEHLCSEADADGRAGVFRLGKRRLWGDFIAALLYLKEAHKKEGEDFLYRQMGTGQGAGMF